MDVHNIRLTGIKKQLVKEIEGPLELRDCFQAKYNVTRFRNTPVEENQKKAVKWAIKVGGELKYVKIKDGQTILADENNSSSGDLEDYKSDHLILSLGDIVKVKPNNSTDIIVMAYLVSPSDKVSVKTNVIWSEVGEFIFLIKELENQRNWWTGEEILNAVRAIAYDDLNFRVMYGGENPLTPGWGITDISLKSKLEKYVSHKGNLPSNETGIASEKPVSDWSVAMGHVLTGISAGVHRIKNLDFPRLYLKAKIKESGTKKARWGRVEYSDELSGPGRIPGEIIDNLHAVTLAGDLGQSANVRNEFRMPWTKSPPYIGYFSESTHAEIIGDIDGFVIGNNLSLFTQGQSLLNKNGTKLSEILVRYYCSNTDVPKNRAKRFYYFNEEGMPDLKEQTVKFAINYAYGHRGLVTGVVTEIGSEAKSAFKEFEKWFNGELRSENSG